MIVGTLPVVITISANLRNQHRDGRLPWRQLLAPLLLIAAGIACVNQDELRTLASDHDADRMRYLSGALLAALAVACWTWYPLRNADWLRGHPGRDARAWATAQGVATLPLALVGYIGAIVWLKASGSTLPLPLGPRPLAFVGLMTAIGLFASWLGTLCWNQASQRLPTALAGQLIVFETLAALAYVFAWQGRWPAPATAVGIGLLLAGVVIAVRIKPRGAEEREHCTAHG